MKKQIHPTIKAHLIRSALFLLLLAVCAIPFALAQRNYRAIGTRFSNANAVTPALKQQKTAQHPPSALAAPVDRKRVAGVSPKKRIAGASPLGLLGTTGYSQNAAFGYYTVFDLGVPEVLPNIAPFDTGNFIGAGEFVNGSVYMVDTGFTMYQVDPLTGTQLGSIPVTPPGGGQSYTGMTLDPITGDVYLASCDITTSLLFRLDVATGAITRIIRGIWK